MRTYIVHTYVYSHINMCIILPGRQIFYIHSICMRICIIYAFIFMYVLFVSYLYIYIYTCKCMMLWSLASHWVGLMYDTRRDSYGCIDRTVDAHRYADIVIYACRHVSTIQNISVHVCMNMISIWISVSMSIHISYKHPYNYICIRMYVYIHIYISNHPRDRNMSYLVFRWRMFLRGRVCTQRHETHSQRLCDIWSPYICICASKHIHDLFVYMCI